MELGNTDDCYFTLMLFCPILFVLVLKNNFVFKSRFRVREQSVILYVFHGTAGRIIGFLLKKVPITLFQNEWIKVLLTFAVIVAAGHLLVYIKEKTDWKILKYLC